MKKLINGIVNFRKHYKHKYCDKFSQLAQRHDPDALFIACCDSRVVPNVFASSDPGDLFVLRNIGNIIPPYQQAGSSDISVCATIEFALARLNVKDIIVCGHSECGAMQAILENNEFKCLTKEWLQYAKESHNIFLQKQQANGQRVTPCNQLSQINVLQQLEHLKTYPLVAHGINNNTLRIHGWWFDLSTADVYYYKASSKKFTVIDEDEALYFASGKFDAT